MMDIHDTDDDLGSRTVNRYSPERVHRLEQQLAELREALDQTVHAHKVSDEWRSHWQTKAAELEAERDRLRDLVKKSQDEVVSFVPMLVELEGLRDAVSAYYGAVITRNSTPYPDPDERMFMARLIDETQAAMFALLQERNNVL